MVCAHFSLDFSLTDRSLHRGQRELQARAKVREAEGRSHRAGEDAERLESVRVAGDYHGGSTVDADA